jgi:hypothetical protein
MYVKEIGLTPRSSFIITYSDFLNIFSYVIVSSINYNNLVGIKHTFLNVKVPAHIQQSKHFYLQVENQCVLDLSLVKIGNCIKEYIRGNVISKRFLKIKVLVARQQNSKGRA